MCAISTHLVEAEVDFFRRSQVLDALGFFYIGISSLLVTLQALPLWGVSCII